MDERTLWLCNEITCRQAYSSPEADTVAISTFPILKLEKCAIKETVLYPVLPVLELFCVQEQVFCPNRLIYSQNLSCGLGCTLLENTHTYTVFLTTHTITPKPPPFQITPFAANFLELPNNYYPHKHARANTHRWREGASISNTLRLYIHFGILLMKQLVRHASTSSAPH